MDTEARHSQPSPSTAHHGSGPEGVWTGAVLHDGQSDEFTISFTPDGVVTLTTPISTGEGKWAAGENGSFSYTLRESFKPGIGPAGYVTVSIDARRDEATYTGSGACTVHSPDGAVVHETFAETTAHLQESAGRHLLADLTTHTPTGPEETSTALATRVSSLQDAVTLAGAQAAQADTERRVQPEVVQALTEAGFARWFVPERFGGERRGYGELVESVVTLGQECSSTAWLASLFAFGTRYITCLPERAQSEVWENGPDATIVAVVKPLGQVLDTEGGWRLSGTWTYVSGVEYSDWALLAGPAPSGPPTAGGRPSRFFLVPRRDYTFQDTWNSLGMRGTGSHTLVLDDVFVPEYRTCLREDAMRGRTLGVDAPPVPTLAVNGLTFVGPALGAARGALEAAKAGVSVVPTGPRQASGQAYQIAYARAAGEIDAAELLIERIAAVADKAQLNPRLIQRSRRDAALALEILTGAVDGLLRTGGTRAQEDPHPLQRFWRDVHSVASHAVVQFEPAAIDYTSGLAVA
ncbi:acyl-CoA dehydrogenase family protein [Streptomyces cyaneofuscatus]|uniref:hydrolase n=1 Tax=Streptomyces cyaneofuscatus TaxID=66883 RepID=UPI003681763C